MAQPACPRRESVKPSLLGQSQLQDLIAQEAAQRQERGYHNLPGAMAADWTGDSVGDGVAQPWGVAGRDGVFDPRTDRQLFSGLGQ